jgi:hypothetical protein
LNWENVGPSWDSQETPASGCETVIIAVSRRFEVDPELVTEHPGTTRQGPSWQRSESGRLLPKCHYSDRYCPPTSD